jgi:hypothetical protein
MSARTPRGGAPGSALRSTGIAKAMAAIAPISVASARRASTKVIIPIARALQPSTTLAP